MRDTNMRSGGCTVQRSLTMEAANVVKQAVTLARRRGHAQVTPLHVANTMLSTSTGLFRTACIQSHSHPLQCRALELCFNVALNRLPASSSSPMLGGHNSQHPSISNALVAAFKRAQAHQRRGCIENQQQPLLAVKIELEQLIISILDDPSVSRVMREAGFSSTQVKSNVEQAVSLEICSQNVPKANTKTKDSINGDHLALSQPILPIKKSDPIIRKEDVMFVIENLMKRERENFVVIGECVSSVEGVVKAVIDKVIDLKFIDLSFTSFGHLNRVEVEQKLEELKNHVSNFLGKGIVFNLGDLKWAIEYRASSSEQSRGYYCPVEHMIMEIGKLVSNIGENARFRLMGFATFQTYMRCKSGHPSLENLWGLHTLTIPAGNLSLSLITSSDLKSHSTSLILLDGEEEEEEKQLSCCGDCSAKYENEVLSLKNTTCNSESTSSNLPPWFQSYKDDNKGLNDKDSASIRQLREKWNSLCNSVHKQPYNSSERIHTLVSSISPPSSSNPNSTHNSASSSDVMEMEYVRKFKELNAENLTTLCTSLEKKVPWQKDIIPEIVSTILKCRSGMLRRKGNSGTKLSKEDTWLFFQGVDVEAKEKISKELAKLVFGSRKCFVTIALSSFSSTRADSIEDNCNHKRLRDEQCCSYIERFGEAVSSNPHHVFFVEDVMQVDYRSRIGFKRAMESGRVSDANGEEVALSDAIIILSCESFTSRSRACSPVGNKKLNGFEEEKVDALDLNISIEDDGVEEQSIDNIGLLESVDRRIIFKIQELL